MNFDHFVGQVQHRARLGALSDAVRAIRATLTTLSERLDPGEAKDLASQLPEEIGFYMLAGTVTGGERFSIGEFFDRVAARERVDLPVAVYHARAVFEVVREAVSPGEIRDVLSELPEDFRAVVLSGSTGRLRLNRRTTKGSAPAGGTASAAGLPKANREGGASVEDKKRAQPLPRIRGASPPAIMKRAAVETRISARTENGGKESETQYTRAE
jgi:uncharacterized protein (DUF2267 family)